MLEVGDTVRAVAVVAPLPEATDPVTVTTTGVEVLAESLAEAMNVAVMLSLPMGKDVVISVATPLPFNEPAPMEFDPLENVTVPLVTGPLGSVTVALSVSLWP